MRGILTGCQCLNLLFRSKNEIIQSGVEKWFMDSLVIHQLQPSRILRSYVLVAYVTKPDGSISPFPSDGQLTFALS